MLWDAAQEGLSAVCAGAVPLSSAESQPAENSALIKPSQPRLRSAPLSAYQGAGLQIGPFNGIPAHAQVFELMAVPAVHGEVGHLIPVTGNCHNFCSTLLSSDTEHRPLFLSLCLFICRG